MCPQCGADPTTGRGGPVYHSGPRVAPGWHRLVRYLAIATGVGLAFVAVLRVLGGSVASTTGWNTWYEGIVVLVAVVAILIGVGIASGAGVRVRPRRGRAAPPDLYHGLSILACGLVVLVVGLAFVPGPKGVLDPGTTPTITGGIQGLAGVLTPTGTPAPATTTSDTMTPSAYRQVVAHDRAMLIRDLASIARAGAGGVIDGAAFERLSNDCQTAGIDSETDLPPDSLSQLASRWNTATNVATLFGQPGSGIVLDLRGMRKPAAAVLSALDRVQAGGEAGIVAQIATDLQQGLWVRKAYKVPLGSYGTVAYGVLDRRAGSLAGRRYAFVGEVSHLRDVGRNYYISGFPHGLKPEVSMQVEVTNEGYGIWDNDLSVIYDSALHHIRINDIVVVYGTCIRWDKSYSDRVPLVHASVVRKIGHAAPPSG